MYGRKRPLTLLHIDTQHRPRDVLGYEYEAGDSRCCASGRWGVDSYGPRAFPAEPVKKPAPLRLQTAAYYQQPAHIRRKLNGD